MSANHSCEKARRLLVMCALHPFLSEVRPDTVARLPIFQLVPVVRLAQMACIACRSRAESDSVRRRRSRGAATFCRAQLKRLGAFSRGERDFFGRRAVARRFYAAHFASRGEPTAANLQSPMLPSSLLMLEPSSCFRFCRQRIQNAA